MQLRGWCAKNTNEENQSRVRRDRLHHHPCGQHSPQKKIFVVDGGLVLNLPLRQPGSTFCFPLFLPFLCRNCGDRVRHLSTFDLHDWIAEAAFGPCFSLVFLFSLPRSCRFALHVTLPPAGGVLRWAPYIRGLAVKPGNIRDFKIRSPHRPKIHSHRPSTTLHRVRPPALRPHSR